MVDKERHELREGLNHKRPKPEEHRLPKELEPEGYLEKQVDELLIRVSGNKAVLKEVRQIVIEFKNNGLEKDLPKPHKEEKGKVLCERKK